MKPLYPKILILVACLFLAASTSFSQAIVFESEPNNGFGTADNFALGDTVRAAISTVGDRDYFMLTVPRAGVFNVSVTNISSPIDMVVLLYDANQVLQGTFGNDGSNGAPVFFRKLVCPPGTYYFQLEDYNNNESAPGLYKLFATLDTSDVYECNNNFQEAAPIALGDTICAAINNNGDKDFYSLTIPRAGVFNVSVTNISSPIDMMVLLYDANQVLQGTYGNDGSNGAPVIFRKLVCPPGTYYFRLEDYSNDESAPGLYKLIATLDTSDVYECNNNFQEAAPIALGDTICAAINSNGDKDFYSLTIPRAGVFNVSVTNISSPIDMMVLLYDANQVLQGTYGNDGSNGAPVIFRKLVCPPGTYYFRLEDYSNDESAPGLYKLIATLDTSDVYECNNTPQTASPIALGDTIRAAINSNGDKDFYALTVPRAGVLDVSVTNISSPIDMIVLLYDANQVLQGTYGNDGSNGAPVIFRKLVCPPGTYYFRLEDYSNDESASSLYKFIVNLDTTDRYECNNSFGDAMPINVCDTVVGTISFNGDEDFYSFNAIGNQRLTFQLSNVPSNVNCRIRIYDPFQTEIYNRLLNLAQPLLDSIMIPSTGQYFIRIVDDGNDASNILPYRLLLRQGCITTATTQASAFSIGIFPNPASDVVRIQAEGTLTDVATVKLYDLSARLLHSQSLIAGECMLDIASLATGMYWIEVSMDASVVRKQLLIQR